MSATRSAIRYAKALLEVSNTKGNASVVHQDMATIAQAISESKELKAFLLNPIIKGNVKLNALLEIFAAVNQDTKSLFQVLLDNKRFDILQAITEQFKVLYDELKGVQVAYVTTATQLNADTEAQVLAKIKQLSTKEISIVNIVNPDIIGGFIIRIGDTQYNASISDKLSQLKREFTN